MNEETKNDLEDELHGVGGLRLDVVFALPVTPLAKYSRHAWSVLGANIG